jgi:hypothetical protein
VRDRVVEHLRVGLACVAKAWNLVSERRHALDATGARCRPSFVPGDQRLSSTSHTTCTRDPRAVPR